MKRIIQAFCLILVILLLPGITIGKESPHKQRISLKSVLGKLLKARKEINSKKFAEEFLNFLSNQYSDDDLNFVLKRIGIPLKDSEYIALEMLYEHWFPILANNVIQTKRLLCRKKNNDGSIRYEIIFLNDEELETYQATMDPKRFPMPRTDYKSTWEERFCGSAKDRLIFICGKPRNDKDEEMTSKSRKKNNGNPKWSELNSVKPTGANIFMPFKQFNAEVIAKSVKETMDMTQVLQMLGHPKEIKCDYDIELWFYTYEFPDMTGEDRWMILMVQFKSGKAISCGSWVPHG